MSEMTIWNRLFTAATEFARELTDRVRLRRRAQLLCVIEGEIVPRLLISTRIAGGQTLGADRRQRPLTSTDGAEFSRLLIEHEAKVAGAYVTALRAGGATLEDLYLDLLAPAARRLEQLSRGDGADLGDLVVAHGRLHNVVSELVSGTESASMSGAGADR